ncbi:MAG: flagellar export protein FliJ [Synergistales bacterium]|nr:flagellar export protein FliJ [Synergistales bacterium]
MRNKIYRFKRVLHTREQQRDQVRVEVAECRERLASAEEQLDTLQGSRRKAMEDFSSQMNGVVCSGAALWCSRSHIDTIEDHIRAKQRELKEVEEELEIREDRLLEQHKEVQKLERYVERIEETNESMIRSKEQATLDDMATTRFLLKE